MNKIHWAAKVLNPVFGFCSEALQVVLFQIERIRNLVRRNLFYFLWYITRVPVAQRVLSQRNIFLLFVSACSTFIKFRHLSPRHCAHMRLRLSAVKFSQRMVYDLSQCVELPLPSVLMKEWFTIMWQLYVHESARSSWEYAEIFCFVIWQIIVSKNKFYFLIKRIFV